MKSLKQQLKTLKKRIAIRNEIRPLFFDQHKKKYIATLFFLNKKYIIILSLAVFCISIIEVATPLFLDIFLRRFSFNLEINDLYQIIGFVGFVLLVYLFFSYKAIAWQKEFSLNIINKVREDWLRYYLNKKSQQLEDRDRGDIFVKISYHLSLLQMGIGNSFFAFFQWSFYLLGILVISSIIDIRLLFISLAFIPINIFIFGISYIFSAYYLAKDQTLYSKILRYISDTFQRFELVKAFHKEKEFINNVRNMINIDNQFRIKREIVLRYGNNIIFTVLTLITIGAYLYAIYSPEPLLSEGINSIIQILIFGLHLRLIYLSLRMGLYYFPLKLGLYLSVPPPYVKHSINAITSTKNLTFASPKVRLYENSAYQKNITFSFNAGENYLIQSEQDPVSVNLAQLFSGNVSSHKGIQWIVKVNKKRYIYSKWLDLRRNSFYIHPELYSKASIFELLNDNSNIQKLKKYEIFNFIFDNKKFISHTYSNDNFNRKEFFLLQVANCILSQPDCVVVDSAFVDLDYGDINDGILLLQKEYSGILIIFSQKRNILHNNYDVTYTISHEKISKK